VASRTCRENRRLFAAHGRRKPAQGAFPREARKRYEERLKFVYSLFPRLEERRGQSRHAFGGEQQMCAIARR